MEFLYYAAFAYIGWRARGWYAAYYINKLLKNVSENIQEAKDNSVILKLEKQNEVIYMYDSKDDTFLGQVTSLDEMVTYLEKQYPGKSFSAHKAELEKVGLKHDSL